MDYKGGRAEKRVSRENIQIIVAAAEAEAKRLGL
jgi:hypothetical protein